ncbi:proliferation marker protein Ki-67 isoform X2 [Xiphias gladius]|uniref:proliferation marker protein Ki-67 isoform X2 n=1 Tax=Xiphias gladius TaxID=8245 RepID=UPI001A980995|nr:proliferation marker protein Ki-67 isoform X2 [Xiphias gladius]
MPLHGKIVVVKRSGGDGIEFPLTATCLFGRTPDCDIRIQLPQVSKEHCRIDLNENKEVILTNLSSVNPTRINGEALQHSERLKHGDVITIIDRSFRFEYPPAPTPKKRFSAGGKTETLKVLLDQQVVDTVTVEKGEKRVSEVFTDGTNHDNIQRSLEKTVEVESKEDGSLPQNKTSPLFGDLYQMIKKSLDLKTPQKSSASLLQTPTSKFCTPKPGSVRKNDGKPDISTEDKSSPNKNEAKVFPGADETKGEVESISNGTSKSVKKQRKSFQVPSEMVEHATKSEATLSQRNRATPQKFTVCEVIDQVSAQTPKSPRRRRSKEATADKPAATEEASPRNSGKADKVKGMSKKRKSGEPAADLPMPEMKRKRVSFGGYLSPELFDKQMPPDSPLRKGATPRRSLCLSKPKQSLLRRASVIGLLKEFEQGSPKVQSPAKKTPSPRKSSGAKNASPKTPTSGKKSPKSRSPSPKAASPGKKSPKSRSPSPKAASPGKKSPKSRSPSPKAASPGKKSPKSRSPSPKAASPSPKAASPGKKSPKSRSPSPKAASRVNKFETPKSSEQPKTQRKSTTPGQVAYKETPTGKRRSSLVASSPYPQENAPTDVKPARTPFDSGVLTPTVQGRFSVSRISTPSPVAEDAVPDQMPLVTATPKIPLRRKSMKSTSRKTPSMAKSAVKIMRRKSDFSRASMKVKNSWADIVKFGQTKAQVAASAKKMVTKKTTKKAVSKPQTPARKMKGHASTGHADSPVTIVVGRAHKQNVVHPTGAAPRVVTNTALFKKNMKLDEDLTGIYEMFKTPVNERKRRSVIDGNNATETAKEVQGTPVVEPSVLNTPEGPGEMIVSPLNVTSTVKGRRYNSEAVQRLLNGEQESSFVSEIPALEIHSDESSEQQCIDVKTATVKTPRQKPEQPDCLTGVKRIMKTPKQKSEPVEDLRGKILKTPKQKPEQQEFLTGIKKIMKTPRQKVEPVEDIRGKLLATPKQKLEQQECLTGVKRIFKTPQPDAEPLVDLREKLLKTPKALEAGDVSPDGVQELEETPAHMQESEVTDMKTPNVKSSPLACLTGVKRLMKTPREKAEPVEENFGIKTLMKSPRLRGNAPVEDFEGLQELMEEPLTDPSGQLETNEVEDQTTPGCGADLAKELDFAHEEPQDDTPSDVINNVPDVDLPKDANEVVHNHMEEMPTGHDNDSSDAMETLCQAAVDESLPVEQPKVETATGKVTEMDITATEPDHKEKSVRGRRAKTVESKAAEYKKQATEHSEDPVTPAQVRGRRGKKSEATVPSTVRQTTRNRNARTIELKMEESASQPSKAALMPKRGRNAKKASDDQAEMVQEVATETQMVPEAEREQIPKLDVVQKVNDSAIPHEKAVSRPKRGRKAKQESEQSEQQDVPQVDMAKDANEIGSDQLEVVPTGNNENKSFDGTETVLQAPVTESLPEVHTETCKVTEMNSEEIVKKKSVRGRRAKLVETKAAEDKQEVADNSEDHVVPAPVRGRRGKKTEAIAPPAVRQPTRTRNAKSQGSTNDKPEMVSEKSVETQPMTEISTEAVSGQTSLINSNQEENDSASRAEEAVVKPTRGRRTKISVELPQPEPEKNEVVSDEHLMADPQPQQPISIVGKPRRGRRTKPDTVVQNEVAEDTVVTVETKKQAQPPVRAKRGRNAKQEEAKQENDGKTTSAETPKSQEPVKKLRVTRKAEQDHVEPREEEIQTHEMVVPEEHEASPDAEPLKLNEQVTVAAKPRRGGRKAKQDTEREICESTEVQGVPAVSSTDKPKRGRRGKQVIEEVGVTAEVPEGKPDHELEAEEKKNAEPNAPAIKPSRARGLKTSVKNEVSQAVPAKRARRGVSLALEETNAASTVLVSESVQTSVEPPKRGRRAAAKPTTDESTVSSDQANPSEDSSHDTNISKRSVKWRADLEVFQIPKVTPVKTVRGRRSKLGEQVEAGSENVSKDANKTEEKDLSDEVVEAQPIKRARRGAKVADEAKSSSKLAPKKGAEAETVPKTRRGRSAK